MNFDKIVFFSVVIIMWVLAVLGLIAYTVSGDTELELKKLQEEFFQWKLKDSPSYATVIGENKYNDIIKDFSLAKLDQRKVTVDSFIEKLKRIDRNQLPRNTKYSYDVFLDTMQTFVDGYKWRYHGNLNPLSALEGFQTDPGLMLKITPFDTKGDFENYISRLLLYPNQIDQIIIRFSESITLQRTLHNVSIIAVPAQLGKLLVDDPKNSAYYIPFKDQVQKLDVTNATKDDLIKRGEEAIKVYIKSIGTLKTFLETKYIPNTRKSYGVDGWSDGQEYYKACLKWHLTTDMSPREVHQKGLEEVRRIKEQMHKIMTEKEGITDSIAGFSKTLMNRPSLKFNTADELLAEYNKLINDIIYPKLSQYFKDIPDYKVIVEPQTYDGPAGQYFVGTEDGSRPGIFQVNLLRPNETLKINMMALTLHETVPGHHLQASYQLKSNLPKFQKNIDYDDYYSIPYYFPFYTSYVEGWGLYAESLGEDMGVYRTHLDLLGRYGFEIFRACRLVVDTGLHYFKWSRKQAIQYMVDHNPISLAEIELEIDRYITWPGQACAYKIGELKIRELREKAKAALGGKFDIKEFHSLVLTSGPVSLSILENIINDWIKDHSPTLIGK